MNPEAAAIEVSRVLPKLTIRETIVPSESTVECANGWLRKIALALQAVSKSGCDCTHSPVLSSVEVDEPEEVVPE